MTAAYIVMGIGFLLLILAGIMALAISRAGPGYEDDDGFHKGVKK